MSLQDQVDVLLSLQGNTAVENDMLHSAVDVYDTTVSNPGVNVTRLVLLDSGTEAFHKPFSGINVNAASFYGQHPDQVPINECVAWRLAAAVGRPLSEIVAPCVMWSYSGEAGSLTRRLEGVSGTAAPLSNAPAECRVAAFFDALIAQQDRHFGNLRWDAASRRLGLFDHGYTFSLPGHYSNAAAFVDWRWRIGGQTLDDWERDALQRLVGDPTLFGLDSALPPDRAAALRARADRMLSTNVILRPGEY